MRTVAFSLLLLAVAHASPEAATPIAAQPGKLGDKPLTPKEAPGKMTVPEGFKVTLFAGEPDIVQPIAFTFDDRGRMWVVECLSYPKWSKDGKGSDRVVILEDTDGDGTFNKKTEFITDGVNLSGIEIGFGGVWLCSSPNLVFIPILADDKPGKPQVVLDGWNMTDTKHNIFNSLGWGPDGWLYGCNGIQAKAWVGTPGTPKEKRAYMDCGVWRYHPTRKIFEPVAHGTTNPFGLDWDENGEMFITNCVIDHLFHVVPGGHYQRMYGQDANPHAYGLMKSCVDYRHWASGNWTDSRSTGVGGDPKHSDAGGGHAHSGCAIYLGDNFPAEYRNTLFTANIHGNRLNNDGLQRTASGMKGVRRKDFLFANDSWFRGICVKCGPDGALYVSDWCDTGECHNYDKCDITNGRIYRVSFGDPKQWKGDVSKLSDAELVKMTVTASNEWFSRRARLVLQERARDAKPGDDTLANLLRDQLTGTGEPRQKLRALWALEALGKNRAFDLETLFESKSEVIRAWAARFAITHPDFDRKQFASKLQDKLEQALENEKSAYVELYVASASIQSHTLAAPSRLFSLNKLSPDSDPNLVLMMWYALEERLSKSPTDAHELVTEGKHPLIRQFAIRFMMLQPNQRLGIELDWIADRLSKSRAAEGSWDSELLLLDGMRTHLRGRKDMQVPGNWLQVFKNLERGGNVAVIRAAEEVSVIFGHDEIIKRLADRMTDPAAKAEDRRAAIEVLRPLKLPKFSATLRELLDDPDVRAAAIRGLASFVDTETPAAIIKAYPKFTTEEKLDAVQTLAARKEWANALLNAVEKKDVPRADIPVTTARQILALNDKALSLRLETVWGKIAPASQARAALTKKWKDILTEDALGKANAANGRAMFVKHCAACHKMFGEGQAVGPELTGSQRTSLDYVLENVLDPSAVVPREFQMVNFTTTDDRVVSGIVLRETKDAITIRTTNDTVVLPTADIASRKQTNVSIMPDGLLDQMKPEEVCDLVAYLRAKEQVPLPK